MSGGFQTAVNDQPAIGVAGDFADTNPIFTVPFGAGGAVAGPNGCIVGRFAWAVPPIDADGAPASVNNSGAGPVTGFIHREQQGLITVYLEDASMTVPQGFQVAVCNGGDFLVKNDGTTAAQVGMKAYANFADGKVTFAATGSPATGGTSTASTIAEETASVTGSISGDILTVTAVGSGTLYPGSALSGSNVPSGLLLGQQISGTAGGIGTYYVSQSGLTVAATTITAEYGLLTIGGTVAGTFAVGDVISGTNVTAGSTITAAISGTGGAGTYVTQYQTTSSTAIDVAATNVETKWYAMSQGNPGELVKISDHPTG